MIVSNVWSILSAEHQQNKSAWAKVGTKNICIFEKVHVRIICFQNTVGNKNLQSKIKFKGWKIIRYKIFSVSPLVDEQLGCFPTTNMQISPPPQKCPYRYKRCTMC